jgi:hypothetical protein
MILTRFGDRDRRRRRRHAVGVLLRWTLGIGALAAVGAYGFDYGRDLARRDAGRLESVVAGLRGEVEGLQAERDGLAARLAETEAALSASEARYDRDVPQGPVKDLAGAIADRLAEGIDPDRLAFVIREVTLRPACEAAPQTKRFLVQTPIGTGAGASVGFGDGAITVTGSGASALDAEGNPLARFDPAKPVTLRFVTLDGRESEVSGPLPLHHRLVDGAHEYRFAVLAGDAGFVSVTAQRCSFP